MGASIRQRHYNTAAWSSSRRKWNGPAERCGGDGFLLSLSRPIYQLTYRRATLSIEEMGPWPWSFLFSRAISCAHNRPCGVFSAALLAAGEWQAMSRMASQKRVSAWCHGGVNHQM